MAQPIVFLLHGMGTHEKGWSDEVGKILEERAKSLVPGRNVGIQVEELEYDSKFADLLGAWSKNSRKIISDAHSGNRDLLKETVGWLNKADSDSFAWTAAADVFLWRASFAVRNIIVNHLANQIAPIVEKAPAGRARNVHIVAHSLGTAVCHELLTALGEGRWTAETEIPIDGFAAKRWRPMGVHMVANVSRALELKRNKVYKSIVKPGPTSSADSYCLFYRSYDHNLDPFTHIAPFHPPWANNGRYERFRPRLLMKAKEVHNFSHYAAIPIVHVPMLEAMFGKLPPDTDAFTQKPKGYKMPSKAIRDDLEEQIEKFGEDSSLFQQVRSVYDFFSKE